MKKVSVIGAGSWGSALAVLLANNGHEVTLPRHFHIYRHSFTYTGTDTAEVCILYSFPSTVMSTPYT